MKRLQLVATLVSLMAVAAPPVWAGPPFQTNDPDPPDLGQFEVIIPLTASRDRAGTLSSSMPGTEINYGLNPYTQVTTTIPVSSFWAGSGSINTGLGDLMFEYKRRFGLDPKAGYFGIDPQVTFPTGSALQGLGAGHLTLDLPILYERQFGSTVVYTDFRYRFHGGPTGASYSFMGVTAEHELNERVGVGAEVFFSSLDHSLNYNVGGEYGMGHGRKLIFSVGSSLRGEPVLSVYGGLVILTGGHGGDTKE